MEKKLSGLEQKTTVSDLIEQQGEVGLLRSMSQSKTLTMMVVIGSILFGGLAWLLVKMAGV